MQDSIQKILDICGDDYDRYASPAVAKGKCWSISEDICEKLAWTDIMYIHCAHDNDPDTRFITLGQHSDHYAVYHEDTNTVIDYTLRQFDPNTPFPFVGSPAQWLDVLERSWEAPNLRAAIGYDCEFCGHVDCQCCSECTMRDHTICNCAGHTPRSTYINDRYPSRL